MTTGVLMFLLVVYMVLGLYIYHAIFDIWYFNFGKAMISEIIGAFIFGALMTGLTMMFSTPVMIIIIILGIILGFKSQNPIRRMATIIAFVVIGIIVGITGHNFKKTQKENEIKKAEEEKLMEEQSQVYFVDNPNSDLDNFVVEDYTYKMVKGNVTTYMNVCWDSPIYIVYFLQIENDKLNDDIRYIELQGSEEWQSTFYGKDDKSSYITINKYDSLEVFVNDPKYDLSGHYSLATATDEEAYYDLYEKSEFSDVDEEDNYEDTDEDILVDEEVYEENEDTELYVVEVAAPDGYVNFRTGAGTDYEIICEIYNGEQLSVYEDTGDWLYVEYADAWGWIAASQVEVVHTNDNSEAHIVVDGYSGSFSNPSGESMINLLAYELPGEDGAIGEVAIYQGDEVVVEALYYPETTGNTDWEDCGYERLYYFYDEGDIYYLGLSFAEDGAVIDYNSAYRNIDYYSECTG